MTLVADSMSFAADSRRDFQRWLISGAVVVLAHATIAAGLMHWRDVDDTDFASAGIVIDLAAISDDPTNTPMDEAPPGPEQVAAEASPEKPLEQPEEKVEEIVRA